MTKPVNLNRDTHLKLILIKNVCGFSTFDETIKTLIETHPRYAEVKKELL